MKPYALAAVAALALAACAPRPATAPSTPAPAMPATAPAATPAPPPPAPAMTRAPAEAPADWQLLDAATDGVPGISLRRAERELLAGKQPRRTVVVAIIDGGVDTAHADLRANLWTNAREVAGNGRDDDGNGYDDDVHGWNFIGGRDGRDVHQDTYEVTRLHAACTGAAAGTATPKPAPAACTAIAAEFTEKRGEAERTLVQIAQIEAAYARALPVLRQAVAPDTLTVERVRGLLASGARPDLQQARALYLQLAGAGLTEQGVAEARKSYETQLRYGLDPAFDPRPIVGDRYANTAERRYGNRDVTGPDAEHGTHVAGIVGALRNGTGIDGVSPAVRLMVVRTVPDGDERDKDVASAIRYAADNGAHIINMSFGKAYSPQKAAVDEAVRHAESKGVLLVHASGNDGENLATEANFPTRTFSTGGSAANWIEVGASSWKGGDSLVASFSNYGHAQVDVFAPGVDILSAKPGGGFARNSGTSMAAPVVSGLAALLMAYYPDLTAADVKRIIMASATRHAEQMVVRPGTPDERVRFGDLSVTGGIVNAHAAVRMAEQGGAPRP